MNEITTHVDEGTFRLSSYRNLLLAWWDTPPNVAQLKQLEACLQQVHREQQAKVGLLNVINSGKPSFDRAASKRASQQLNDNADITYANAHLVNVDGLRGAAVRSFLSTINLMSSSSTPVKVFGDVDSAADWLMEFFATDRLGLKKYELLRAFELFKTQS